MRRAGRAIPRVCGKTFLIESVLLESFQAVNDLAGASQHPCLRKNKWKNQTEESQM
jgi:hypothetical protein